MVKMRHLDQAIAIAAEAHSEQSDKVGNPFFDHSRRVAEAVSGDDEKTVAYLHDVVERGRGWTLDRLKQDGLPGAILAAVDALTRRSDEDYEDFVRRASSNPLARPVKRADLEDNRLQCQQIGRDASKYQRGLDILDSVESAD